jgi:hypothetical protein
MSCLIHDLPPDATIRIIEEASPSSAVVST